ncbi:hypothetical protein IAU60_001737 [Kwoniella sp. DSM 27419]
MSFILSPTTISSFSPTTSNTSRFQTPSPSPSGTAPSRAIPSNGLLIPTDRTLEELEAKWLGRLGRLKVDREVVLYGYALYSLRSWYLSRTHFSQTIVTQTGKPTEQVSAYLIVPHPSLSEQEGAEEIQYAIQLLASESQSQPRKTEYGTLLVTTPSAFGQDVSPVPGGDYRVAKPYSTVNTGLRRLGCGGRAFIGLELPIPALRRKFHELYRIPVPSHAPLSRTSSPSASPTKILSVSPLSNPEYSPGVHSPDAITSDPFSHLVIELVKLIQAALAMWGLYGADRQDMEIDGLFCDETKAGIFQWRRVMGMEHEESLKLEKETSGGCIDPKTLAALLSSVTSVHYELDALDIEKLPKDPFSSIRRFLKAWSGYQVSMGKSHDALSFLTVPLIRSLNQQYLAGRTRHPTDALRVHKLLLSGVAQATSSLHANLKGSAADDTPLRKREHHLRFRGMEEDNDDSGVVMIIPEGEVGAVAPPDVITTDLEAYIKGILRSREKDWDLIGARRIAELWNGTVAELADDRPRRKGRVGSVASVATSHRGDRGVLKKRTASRDFGANGTFREDEEADNLKDAIKEISGRAGQALKGGFGLVNRRHTVYETSDSETGGPGPSTLKHALMRTRGSTVPTVIEPDVEEIDEQLDREQSASPSPSTSLRPLDRQFGSVSTRPSFLTANSRTSKRPSINTQLSGNESDMWSRISLRGRSPTEERSDLDLPPTSGSQHAQPQTPQNIALPRRGATMPGPDGRPGMPRNASERALAWRNKGRATTMLRTSSDGADVVVEETGMEWEVTNPRGTGKREDAMEANEALTLSRRHSLVTTEDYQSMRRVTPEHLRVDVEMCAVVLELRVRERQLAQRAKDVKLLEESVFRGADQLVKAMKTRRQHVATLSHQADSLRSRLESLDVEDDQEGTPGDRFHYYLSEETHRPELLDDLEQLKEMWVDVRRNNEERRIEVEGQQRERKGWLGWFFWSS